MAGPFVFSVILTVIFKKKVFPAATAAATPENPIAPDLKTDNLNVKMKSDAFDKKFQNMI